MKNDKLTFDGIDDCLHTLDVELEAVRKNEYEKYYVVLMWERFGGSFQKGLSKALSHADFVNTIKIKANWHDEWNKALEQVKTQPEYKNDL
jgi:hypothetical protein